MSKKLWTIEPAYTLCSPVGLKAQVSLKASKVTGTITPNFPKSFGPGIRFKNQVRLLIKSVGCGFAFLFRPCTIV